MDDLIWTLDSVDLAGTGRPRLAGASLRVRRGTTAVMGCSGAGKTSLLNLLVGFESPDSGSVRGNLPGEGAGLPLFWVPQDGGLWPNLTVREHLEAVTPDAAAREGLDDLLGDFDMQGLAKSSPGELSMGERSRLAVMRALASGAGVLVMDEPLAHVDEARAPRYWRAVRERIAASGASLVFATHRAERVVAEAEHVICLKDGRVLYEGEVADLYWRPQTREQAECLGEVNWLDGPDARLWLGNGQAGSHCYRPEHLTLARSDRGGLIVRSTRFRGPVAETELQHDGTGRVRTFVHRSTGEAVRTGQRVVLKVLTCLLVLLLLAGCGRGDVPALEVRDLSCWAMPPDGPRVPAPRCLATGPMGEVYCLDTAARVLVFDRDGKCRRWWRMPDTEAGNPEGLCVLRDGRLAVCDTHYNRVVLFTLDGEVVGQFGRFGKGAGEFMYPSGIAQDEAGDLYVAEYGGHDRVQKFTCDGEFLMEFGRFGTDVGEFQRPGGMAWRDGLLYVADAMNGRITMFDAAGRYVGLLSGPEGPPSLQFPYDVALGPGGVVYVVEYGAGRLSKLGREGHLLGRYGRIGSDPGAFSTPWGLTVCEGDRLLVADTGNRRIVELTL